MKKLKEFGFNTESNVYVIAEIGINHGGDIDTAKKLIDSAARTGVDAVKFQTYITEKRVSKSMQEVYQILEQCELPFDTFKELKDYSAQYNLDFFSTPFDEESIDFLESINCDRYKIASIDVVNTKLIKKIANTGKSVIMSVGMSNVDEIKKSYEILKEKTKNASLLYCVSSYPTKDNDANLSAISTLKDNFDCVVGYSDHTPDIQVPLYAVAAGAQIIEKHFKIDNDMKCVDEAVSITESKMKEMVGKIRKLEEILGDGKLGICFSEKESEAFRRKS